MIEKSPLNGSINLTEFIIVASHDRVMHIEIRGILKGKQAQTFPLMFQDMTQAGHNAFFFGWGGFECAYSIARTQISNDFNLEILNLKVPILVTGCLIHRFSLFFFFFNEKGTVSICLLFKYDVVKIILHAFLKELGQLLN